MTVIEIFGLRLTEGGIYMAIIFSLRVVVFVGIAFFISLTIAPPDMAEVLVGWLKPFKRIGVPSYDIGLIVFIAMRFIPVLAEEFETIRKAQTARGVDFKGRLTERAKKLTYLLIPVFQSAIRRADELAVAIESRGFISGAERSSYSHFRFLAIDWLFLSSSIIIALVLFWVTSR
jgi:energy-coupling factor transport system permease protein